MRRHSQWTRIVTWKVPNCRSVDFTDKPLHVLVQAFIPSGLPGKNPFGHLVSGVELKYHISEIADKTPQQHFQVTVLSVLAKPRQT